MRRERKILIQTSSVVMLQNAVVNIREIPTLHNSPRFKQGWCCALQAASEPFCFSASFRSVLAPVDHAMADQSRFVVRQWCKRGCWYERRQDTVLKANIASVGVYGRQIVLVEGAAHVAISWHKMACLRAAAMQEQQRAKTQYPMSSLATTAIVHFPSTTGLHCRVSLKVSLALISPVASS